MNSLVGRLGRSRASSLSDIVEFYSIPEPNSGCWLWIGNWNAYGYGRYGNRVAAHRLSFEAHHGAVPSGLVVCHRCDTPACVNPSHLFAGTHQANSDDMMRKHRYPLGDMSQARKISVSDVLAIRSDKRSQKKIAADYGLDQSQISRIKRGRKWAYVNSEGHLNEAA